jgi:hypothetical protein
MKIKTLENRKKDILLLMEYAVPKEYHDKALEVLNRYEADVVALNLFNAFYSYLPEAEDDAIHELRLLDQKQGNFLLCATTLHDKYVYAVSAEQAEFLGNTTAGIWDEEILAFYGYKDRDAFVKACENLDRFEQYMPAHENMALCPACSAHSGELHTFGCPVEICPWCGSQLTNCNCRFIKSGNESIVTESHIDALLEKLETKGRIPYDAKLHRPSYLSEETLPPKNKG